MRFIDVQDGLATVTETALEEVLNHCPVQVEKMSWNFLLPSHLDIVNELLTSLLSEAHGSRKLPKASSTGTMSSDDLDEKDTLQEAGMIYFFFYTLCISMADNAGVDFLHLCAESEEGLSDSNGMSCKPRAASSAALTHRLRKMKSKMVKCKQCDNYILVNGIECEEVSVR